MDKSTIENAVAFLDNPMRTLIVGLAIAIAVLGIVLPIYWKFREKKAKREKDYGMEEQARTASKVSFYISWFCALLLIFIGTLFIGLFPSPWNSIACIISGVITTGCIVYTTLMLKSYRKYIREEGKIDEELKKQ